MELYFKDLQFAEKCFHLNHKNSFQLAAVFSQQMILMRDTDQSSISYVPLPSPKTHQSLIFKIKKSLKLAHMESSFISRDNILQYIEKIHGENQLIRKALNPSSIEAQIANAQRQCALMRDSLNQCQEEEQRLRVSVSRLDEDLIFMEEYYCRNKMLCENIERQIQYVAQDRSASLSHCETEQISNLMDRFMGYFQEAEDREHTGSLQFNSAQGKREENSSQMDEHKSMILREEAEDRKGSGQFQHPKLEIASKNNEGLAQEIVYSYYSYQMKQKYSSSLCTVSNLSFQIVHKGKLVTTSSSPDKSNCHSSLSKLKAPKLNIDGFIPTSFNLYKKQLACSLKILRRETKPLKGQDLEHRGFPVRKVKTSFSHRSIKAKKQKNFMLGQYEPPVFSNPKLNQLIKTEIKQKESSLPQYMSKSALDNYHSQRSNSSAKMRRSII